MDQFKKNLQAVRESNSVRPAVVALNDGSEQAQFVAQRILELRDENVDLNEIAVLYRAHYHAIALARRWFQHAEDVLLRVQILVGRILDAIRSHLR